MGLEIVVDVGLGGNEVSECGGHGFDFAINARTASACVDPYFASLGTSAE